MTIYQHRANDFNTILNAAMMGHGIEVDIRTHQGVPYLYHDVITNPKGLLKWDLAKKYIKEYEIPTIIDFKESGIANLLDIEGIEHLVVATDLIYIDQIWIRESGSKLRTLSRFSPDECISSVHGLYWFDMFFNDDSLKVLNEAGRWAPKGIVVSPELHGKPLTDEYIRNSSNFLGICTDFPERYENLLLRSTL